MSLAYRGPATVWSAQSLAASVTSDPITAVGSMELASAQLSVTSAAALNGTFEVQVSNDPLSRTAQTAGSAIWTTIQSVTITADGTTVVSWFNAHLATRVKWTSAAGTGTAALFIYGTSA